ncbi:hypothetical protein BATDEDRAFT_33617 [Batrachochytrium dendrobatidis JAM81]|uniref:Splicing factor 3B subunit 4 n=2 Tax=Batrachochytrium dendrobatidis TaxID=109871 RepID=F4PA70_BATDJ|nr:uncharacterized protein BATDEDRAFT_33617 [Batrachochytrium dendrobatidis JAM81]EGF77850.1 hypothetical protein BATDEDRAFT_33617 [Batrachochytrium dendrobatidis JAM81]KAJ8330191.1 Spliceosome-associated protein 49 [Batrachochytrium dendrobatidis]KAK5670392.1 Spliceosome-associated protein 49 [Batrachochytrium dendrobatidis]OAJ44007.1 hypothetical protein BDEG_27306 [Batrachochytrium dendrobatidis JEL423]|eukprot:XP_006681445.1 hypothetical protein BATDEDRAFT_33617 [Batrachochytrium dendrobatidis JAM81]
MNRQEDRNKEASVYVGNIEDRATDSLIWELFLQAGPVVNVYLPKDRVTQMHQGYGFVEFMTEQDAEYASKVMNMVRLYGKPLRVNKATSDKMALDVGATLFISNLDMTVDEKALYDTFSAFGMIASTPKISRNPETGESKGYGFVSFSTFEASDAAIEAMNGQFLANRAIAVSYALKKDGKGERHGSAAERLLAAQSGKTTALVPNQNFADIPSVPSAGARYSDMPAAGFGYPTHGTKSGPPPGFNPTPGYPGFNPSPSGYNGPPGFNPNMAPGFIPPTMGVPPGSYPPPGFTMQSTPQMPWNANAGR